MPKTKIKIPTPEFVDKIVTDLKKNVNVLLLTGIPGRALEKEHTRLYLDAQLSRYLEIPDEAILHFEPVGPESSSLGAVYIWIESEAQLIHPVSGSERAQAKFFEGPLAQAAAAIPHGAMAAASIGGFGGGCDTPYCPTHVYHCVTVPQVGAEYYYTPACTPFCPIPTRTCPIHTPTCPIASFVCPPTPFCPIPTRTCPIHTPTCPIESFVCPPTAFCPRPTLVCPVHTPLCPIASFACPVQTAACPTLACPTLACPTFACPSLACGGFGGTPQQA